MEASIRMGGEGQKYRSSVGLSITAGMATAAGGNNRCGQRRWFWFMGTHQ